MVREFQDKIVILEITEIIIYVYFVFIDVIVICILFLLIHYNPVNAAYETHFMNITKWVLEPNEASSDEKRKNYFKLIIDFILLF